MDWEKELKETNWFSVFIALGFLILFFAVIFAENLPSMPSNFQYVLAIAVCFCLIKDSLKKGE